MMVDLQHSTRIWSFIVWTLCHVTHNSCPFHKDPWISVERSHTGDPKFGGRQSANFRWFASYLPSEAPFSVNFGTKPPMSLFFSFPRTQRSIRVLSYRFVVCDELSRAHKQYFMILWVNKVHNPGEASSISPSLRAASNSDGGWMFSRISSRSSFSPAIFPSEGIILENLSKSEQGNFADPWLHKWHIVLKF